MTQETTGSSLWSWDKDAPFMMTVKGPIDPETNGHTLLHEHLQADQDEMRGTGPRVVSMWNMPRFLEGWSGAASEGVKTIVEANPAFCGARPHPLMMRLVAELTGLNVICATGTISESGAPPAWAFAPGDVEYVSGRLLEEVKYGIEGRSGVKPGLLKTYCSHRAISIVDETMLRAAARTQQITGLGILVHSHETMWAEEIVDILEDAGADLSRVAIAHIGWGLYPNESERHIALAERGVTLSMDNIGCPHRPVSDYIQFAYDVIEAGLEDRVTLAHDQAQIVRGLTGPSANFDRRWYTGNTRVIHRQVLPALRERGVSEETIETIMVRNPRRILTVDPVRYPGAVETLLWRPELSDPIVGGDYSELTGHKVGIDPLPMPT